MTDAESTRDNQTELQDVREWFEPHSSSIDNVSNLTVVRKYPHGHEVLNDPYGENPQMIPINSVSLFDIIRIGSTKSQKAHYVQIQEIHPEQGIGLALPLNSPKEVLEAVSTIERGEN